MRRLRARGYTVVELMMALAVFTTGVTGIVAMQRATASANRHARAVVVATGIAQAWLDQLTAESGLWRTDLSQTTWLKSINTGSNDGNWQLPDFVAARRFGPRFNVFGEPDTDADDYCAQIRLTWLYPDENNGGVPGTGVIRTEVRVFWLRDGASRVDEDCTGTSGATMTAVTGATDSYHFVHQAGAVAQHRN